MLRELLAWYIRPSPLLSGRDGCKYQGRAENTPSPTRRCSLSRPKSPSREYLPWQPASSRSGCASWRKPRRRACVRRATSLLVCESPAYCALLSDQSTSSVAFPTPYVRAYDLRARFMTTNVSPPLRPISCFLTRPSIFERKQSLCTHTATTRRPRLTGGAVLAARCLML